MNINELTIKLQEVENENEALKREIRRLQLDIEKYTIDPSRFIYNNSYPAQEINWMRYSINLLPCEPISPDIEPISPNMLGGFIYGETYV